MFDDYESFDGNYLDTQPFRLYVAVIRNMLAAAPDGMTIREIHRELGDAAMTHWTMDALAAVKGISQRGVLITRYSLGPIEREPSPSAPITDMQARRRHPNDWVGGGVNKK